MDETKKLIESIAISKIACNYQVLRINCGTKPILGYSRTLRLKSEPQTVTPSDASNEPIGCCRR